MTETLHDKCLRITPQLTQDFTKAFEQGDYQEALNKLFKVTELVKGLLIITQLTRGV